MVAEPWAIGALLEARLGRGPIAQADVGGDAGQRGDHERDVRVEVHPQLLGPAVDVVAVDGSRERLVAELLAYRRGLQPGDGAAGAHERTGVDEPGQLVTGVERAVQARDPRH